MVVRCATLLAALSMVAAGPGCGGIFGSGGAAKKSAKPETEESGVQRINDALKEYRAHLKKKEFDYATKFLSKAIKLTKNASVVTRGHPDFEDIEDMVERSRERLEAAIEQDRIARRNARIADLIARGEKLLGTANAMYVTMSKRVLREQDIGQVDDLVRQLTDLRAEGGEYLTDEGYAQHAVLRDTAAANLTKARDGSQSLLQALAPVTGRVHSGFSAAARAVKEDDPDEQLQLLGTAGKAFEDCVAVIGQVERKSYFAPAKIFKTRMGELSIADTKRSCLDLAGQARNQIQTRTWARGVKAVVGDVNAALEELRKPEDATEELELARGALEALGRCAASLTKAGRKTPGYDPELTFQSGLGEVSAGKLGQACTAEKKRIEKTLPKIEWRTTLAGIQQLIGQVNALTEGAAVAQTGAERADRLEQADSALQQCRTEAAALARKKGADRNLKIDTVLGSLTIVEIGKACTTQGKSVAERLAKAVAQRETEGFAKDARGAELDVIRREGVPARIELNDDGRTFVYTRFDHRGHKEVRRFSFDGRGALIDYAALWREDVGRSVGALQQVIALVKAADTIAEKKDATERAITILDACEKDLVTSQAHPGYDPRATFPTPMGALTTKRLIRACVDDRARLRGKLESYAWQARLIEVRDVIDSVQAKLNQTSATEDPKARITLVTALAAELETCAARAAELPTLKGFDPSFEVDSSVGSLDAGAAKGACEVLLDEAIDAGEKAARDAEIAKFVERCKKDEVDVARREGVPTKVISFGSKRVFVYGKSAGVRNVEKRYAFNENGEKISEAELLADLSIEPEIEELPMPELEAPIRRGKKGEK